MVADLVESALVLRVGSNLLRVLEDVHKEEYLPSQYLDRIEGRNEVGAHARDFGGRVDGFRYVINSNTLVLTLRQLEIELLESLRHGVRLVQEDRDCFLISGSL